MATRSKFPAMLGMLCVISMIGVSICLGDGEVRHVQLWMVNQAPAGSVAPPWTLQWERSPIWFERSNPAGLSESPSRRVAVTDTHALTVARRTLYFLNKTTGRTEDSLELLGDEIFDWTIVGGYFVYSSWDRDTGAPIHGAVELARRKTAWSGREAGRVDLPEWLVPVNGEAVIFGSNRDGPTRRQFMAVDVRSGKRRWAVQTPFALGTIIPDSWFVYNGKLWGLVSPRERGLQLAQFDIGDGRQLSSLDVAGPDYVGNIFQPRVVSHDGTLYIGWNKLGRPEKRAVVAFTIRDGRPLWSVPIAVPPPTGYVPATFKHVAIGLDTEPVVVTMRPNRIIAIDRDTGAIKKEMTLPGYAGWTEPNALLYSYPYVFTSARRATGSGMAYDLVAINIESMQVAWSYEISRESEIFGTARAEILNFALSGEGIFVARADSRIMAFRPAPSSR